MLGKWHLGFCQPGCLPTAHHFSYRSCDGDEARGFDLHDGDRPAWETAGNFSTLLYVERPPTHPCSYWTVFCTDTSLRRHYAAMLSCLDDGVGPVVQELKTSGLYQNSVLIHSSNNGGQSLYGGATGLGENINDT
ncbi:Arylsulfatase I [Liparis tanakae]|uniref:Arylsulfatase I n=1 Tax=Liparis tanakae TaxID=230148 RepID=A0A4Z2HD19_9TELE|nr:Arylsulfatase I [Liparis tanakae]